MAKRTKKIGVVGSMAQDSAPGVGGGGGYTLGIFGWGCAAGTLEPLVYTTASSPEFCYPRLD